MLYVGTSHHVRVNRVEGRMDDDVRLVERMLRSLQGKIILAHIGCVDWSSLVRR